MNQEQIQNGVLMLKGPKGEMYADPFPAVAEAFVDKELAPEMGEEAAYICVDFQDDFSDENGGLPLMRGGEALRKAQENSAERSPGLSIHTMDQHSEDNIGNAVAHGLNPFDHLILNGNNEVMVVRGENLFLYEDVATDSKFSKEGVAEYLRKQKIAAYTRAVLTGATAINPSDLGQTLWPLHATKREFSEKYLAGFSRQPDSIGIKGLDDESDSYSQVANAVGKLNTITTVDEDGEEVTLPFAQKFANNLKGKGIQRIFFNGLATTHCVLNTARDIKMLQELSKFSGYTRREELSGYVQSMLGQMGVEDEAIVAGVLDNIVEYLKAGVEIPHGIELYLIVDETDPVRRPNFTEEAQKAWLEGVMEEYKRLGVNIIFGKQIVNQKREEAA